MNSSEAKKRLEAGEWRASAVVAEDELVEIDRQVLRRDAVMGALQPGLEVGDRAMRAWQEELPVGVADALLARLVIETGGVQAAVALPAVGSATSTGRRRC